MHYSEEEVNLMTSMTNVVEAAGESENDNPEKIEIQKSQLEEMMKQAQAKKYENSSQSVIACVEKGNG